jgi:hypothetical protein
LLIHWVGFFAQATKQLRMLGSDIKAQSVNEIFDNVAFIVFNYDRCLEYFLENALQLVYNIKPNQARSIIDDLNIIHPYGLVGTSKNGAARGFVWRDEHGGLRGSLGECGAAKISSKVCGRHRYNRRDSQRAYRWANLAALIRLLGEPADAEAIFG